MDNIDYGYGKRADGTYKGIGYLGKLDRPDGGFSTELSAGVDLGHGEIQIPTIVPTLTEEQLNRLLALPRDHPIPKDILDKAVEHAITKLKSKQSPFYVKPEGLLNH